MTLTNWHRSGSSIAVALFLLMPGATPHALDHQIQSVDPSAGELRQSDAALDRMIADGVLRRSRLADDTLLRARTHERLDGVLQRCSGVRRECRSPDG